MSERRRGPVSYDEISYWHFIGISEDVVRRPEYKELVELAKAERYVDMDIPVFICGVLYERERRGTLWRLIKRKLGL